MKRTFLLFLVLAAMSSCSRFVQIQRNPDIEARYNAALDYYDEGDYYRAGLLLEELIPNLIGSAKAENAQYFFAQCNFKQRQYTASAHYFKSFFDTYRRSDRAPEALYLHAYSLYLGTPEYHLDQSQTETAVNALQEVINLYPQDEYAQKSFEYIQKLRSRLEKKAFENARLYYNLGRYKAAVIAFDNFRKDFPDSQMREYAAYLKLKSEYELAKISIQSLKAERFKQVVDDYLDFIDRYKASAYLKDAESLYDAAQRALRNL